jgi:hypothetical protein
MISQSKNKDQEKKESHTVLCACCGSLFEPKIRYFVYFGTIIFVCGEPCTFSDFIQS